MRAWRPGPGIRLAPDHVLSANDLWLEFCGAAAQDGDECGVWDGDLEVLHKHGRERLITDVRLEYTRRQGKRVVTWVLLTEIDRDTRKLTDLYGQVRAYAQLHSRQRAWVQAYRVWPRVLFVLTMEDQARALRRAHRLRELCAADPEIVLAVRAAVTTQALLRQGPLGEVWLEFYAAAAQADDECGVWDGDLEVLHKHGRERLITDVRLEYTRRQGKRVVTWVLLVEIDRGTRKLTDLYGQVRAYARLHSRQRAWAQAYRVWPRVLIVLAMEHQAALRRARRLRELCAADPEIGPAVRAAVTTQALLRQGPLGDVWLPLGAPPLSPAVSLLELRSIREAAS